MPTALSLHSARALDLLLCEHSERTLSKNLTLQYRNTLYQLQHRGAGYHLRGAKVTVCEGDNGEVVLLAAGKELPYTTYQRATALPKTEDEKTLNAQVDAAVGRQSVKPGPNHPWRKPAAIVAAQAAEGTP